ncbi:type I-E CRISPR-associated protein Cse2/CasB [Prauserella flavalba]|nr:type I-E CRISPR-associated protein Cse2/CasB [Prauserella flavalba]
MTETVSFTELMKSTVDKRVSDIQGAYLRNRPGGVAALARLRRGLGRPPGSVLDILDFTYAKEFVGDPNSDEPTRAEAAAHLAMTLYAAHQQSQSQPMHKRGERLGRSIRMLITEKDVTKYVEHSVAHRFAALGTADSLAELSHHLRGIVQLLRANGVPIDYGRLAVDLLHWQYPDRTASVKLRWGRDFHFPANQNTDV